jgi:peptidoglycan-associated lipoprotein
VAAAPPAVNEDSIRAANARRDSLDRVAAARRDSMAREQARVDSIARARTAAEHAANTARTTITERVYFEFDQSDIRDDARRTLDAKLPILRDHPGIRLRIEGNADERGAEEYNLALGQRRAAAAKRYLVGYGIGDGRIDVTSNGVEHPVCQEHDESCWSQNRRDDFVVVAGDDQLMATHP